MYNVRRKRPQSHTRDFKDIQVSQLYEICCLRQESVRPTGHYKKCDWLVTIKYSREPCSIKYIRNKLQEAWGENLSSIPNAKLNTMKLSNSKHYINWCLAADSHIRATVMSSEAYEDIIILCLFRGNMICSSATPVPEGFVKYSM